MVVYICFKVLLVRETVFDQLASQRLVESAECYQSSFLLRPQDGGVSGSSGHEAPSPFHILQAMDLSVIFR